MGFVIDTSSAPIESFPQHSSQKTKTCAWMDSDDQEVTVDLSSVSRLRKLRSEEDLEDGAIPKQVLASGAQYERLHPRPSWASSPSVQDHDGHVKSDEDDNALSFLPCFRSRASAKKVSAADTLVKSADIGAVRYLGDDEGHSLAWSPSGTHIASAGSGNRLQIFALPKEDSDSLKLDSPPALVRDIHFKSLPVACAKWSSDGSEIIVSGGKPYYYSVDTGSFSVTRLSLLGGGLDARSSTELPGSLPTMAMSSDYIAFSGLHGFTHVIHRRSRHCVGRVKAGEDATIKGLAFSPAQPLLWTLGVGAAGSDITSWDLRMLSSSSSSLSVFSSPNALCRFSCASDGLCGTAMSLSPDGETMAVGSSQGIVSLYATQNLSCGGGGGGGGQGSKLSELDQLTTYISDIDFSFDSSLVAFASGDKKNSIRIASITDGGKPRIIPGWPSVTSMPVLGHVCGSKWSPQSHHLAVSNKKGRLLLFGLQQAN